MRLEQSIGNTDRSHTFIHFKYIHDNCQCTGIPPVCFVLTCLKCWKSFCTPGSVMLPIGFLNRIERDTMPHTCAVERVRWQPQQFNPLSLSFSLIPLHTHTYDLLEITQYTHVPCLFLLLLLLLLFMWLIGIVGLMEPSTSECKHVFVCIFFNFQLCFSCSLLTSIFLSMRRIMLNARCHLFRWVVCNKTPQWDRFKHRQFHNSTNIYAHITYKYHIDVLYITNLTEQYRLGKTFIWQLNGIALLLFDFPLQSHTWAKSPLV